IAARDRVQVAVPLLAEPAHDRRLRDDLVAAGIDVRHDLVDVDAPDALALFARHDLRIASMGRPAEDDPALFQAAAAAGALAAARLPERAHVGDAFPRDALPKDADG